MKRHKQKRHTRQWNDWRCYRCGRWSSAGDGVIGQIDSPIGALVIRVCQTCDVTDSAEATA